LWSLPDSACLSDVSTDPSICLSRAMRRLPGSGSKRGATAASEKRHSQRAADATKDLKQNLGIARCDRHRAVGLRHRAGGTRTRRGNTE
jgi:hypothetical protein